MEVHESVDRGEEGAIIPATTLLDELRLEVSSTCTRRESNDSLASGSLSLPGFQRAYEKYESSEETHGASVLALALLTYLSTH